MKKTPIWFWPIFAGFLFLSKLCFLVFVLYVAETRPHPVEGPAQLNGDTSNGALIEDGDQG